MRTYDDATAEQKKLFDDFNLLFNVESMSEMKKRFNQEREAGKNQPFYRAYLSIVKKTAQLLKELKIEDTLIKCSTFYYLLWLGMFSKDCKFEYAKKSKIPNPAALGANIMTGKAVCLNNADMLSRVLRSDGEEAYIMGCEVANIKADPIYGNARVSNDWKTIIESNLDNSHIRELYRQLEALSMLELGNHAVTLFNYYGHYYLADPTNLSFLSFTDFLEATYAGENIKAIIRPASTLVLDEIDPRYYKELIIRTLMTSDELPLSKQHVNRIGAMGRNMTLGNLPLVEDFHRDIEPEIDIICKTLK